MVHLQLPDGTTGSTVLDGQLVRSAEPLGMRVVENPAQYGDAVGTGWASLLLISPAIQAVLARFEGWELITVSSPEHRLRGYAVLSVKGRIGPVVEDANGMGLYVDPATWDGNAVFKPENRRGVWMTGMVASALRRARLKGLNIDRYLGWEPVRRDL
jgi:hypothetical protein